MKILFPIIIFCFIHCTSKNRFEQSNGTTVTDDPSISHSSANPSINKIKGNITDVESDAIPYLKIQSDTPKWNMSLGMIQDGIYDVKLDMISDNKIYLGILKKVQNGSNPGDFFIGELTSDKMKFQIQVYAEKLNCSDNMHQIHNARITMLKDGKEFYACGDYLN